MKYISKEIIKNVDPIAEQDFQVSGNLNVTGTARANTVTVLGDLSKEWTITMDAQDNLNFAYNGNTLITYDNNGNISGTVATYQENFVIATSDGQIAFTFSAPFAGYNSTTPADSHLEIYWNGSRLMYGANYDYTITANNQITLTSGTGILTGDIIFAISISNMTLSRLYTP